MTDATNSAKGYIVFDCGGISPISSGAAEEWFRTYDEAISYAMKIVSSRVESLKRRIDGNEVMVYEAEQSVLNESHRCPCGRVVFYWNNYKYNG